MSSKNFGILNKIKSKSIDKLFNNNISSSYQYIDDFDNVSEEDCIKLDNLNRELYKKNIELYESISKKMENKNAMFKIDNKPTGPPEPNNHEKYISYKLRNIEINVRYQSFAIQYLLNKGYILHYDKIENKTNLDFEPFQAIELFEKLENVKIENIFKEKKYTNYLNCVNYSTQNRKSVSFPLYNNDYLYNQQPPISASAPSAPIIYPQLEDQLKNTQISSQSYPNLDHQQRYISAPPASHFIARQ